MDRGIALSRQYGVDRLLQPIFDFVPTADSPPLAPKHITAPPVRPRRRGDAEGQDSPASASAVKAQRAAINKAALAARRAAAIESRRLAEEEEEMMDDSEDDMMGALNGQYGQSHHQQQQQLQHQPHHQQQHHLGDMSMEVNRERTPTELSESSETPSPLGSDIGVDDDDPEYGAAPAPKKRKSNAAPPQTHQQQLQQQHQHQMQMQHSQQQQQQQPDMGGVGATVGGAHHQLPLGPLRYARMILDYFVSESTQVPQFLVTPPADFDANVVIDDDGHTALHWACAMGRIRIVKLLLTAGADIFRANSMGQTALMRSVMFTNNYDLRKFPELFELLHRSTINIDRNDRTVFHYIVDIALQKGKTHAARYYIETVLARLVDYPKEVADILNFQDEEGETALTLAARARSKRLVKILLDNGADPKIANRDGKTAEDYILEDERFREQELAAQGGYSHAGAALVGHGAMMAGGGPSGNVVGGELLANGHNAAAVGLHGVGQAHLPPVFVPQLHTSESGQRASSKCIPQMADLLESLSHAFDAELGDKDRDLTQAQALLSNIEAELAESHRTAQFLTTVVDELAGLDAHEADLREQLEAKMGKRFRLGWEKWVRDEDAREMSYEEELRAHEEGGAGASSGGGGGGDGTGFERQFDLDQYREFLAHPPHDVQDRQRTIRARLDGYKQTRRDVFKLYTQRTAQMGTGPKMAQYRQLIALGCGVPVDQVDGAIKSLLEEMKEDDDSELQPQLQQF